MSGVKATSQWPVLLQPWCASAFSLRSPRSPAADLELAGVHLKTLGESVAGTPESVVPPLLSLQHNGGSGTCVLKLHPKHGGQIRQ